MAAPYTEEKERVVFEFDEFRADPVRRRLLRAGEPVAVTPKALSILVVLLERAGEVVDKAELIEKVWPGAFVTEANLTQNVFSLRKSLGERANEPRYVLTIPGQGYSFGGEVRRLDRMSTGEIPIITGFPAVSQPVMPVVPEAPAVAAKDPDEEPTLTWTLPPRAAAPPAPPRPRLSLGKRAGLVLALLAMAGVVVAGILTRPRPAPVPTATPAAHSQRSSVAVLDFRSLSPSPDTKWLEIAFAEMVATELAASSSLRIIRGETVTEAQRSLSYQEDGVLERHDARKLHEILGADRIVLGSYVFMKGKIRLDLRVIRAPEGDAVASLAEVGTEPGLFDLISRTGSKLRLAMGVGAPSQEQVRQAQALQPSSTEVSRLYAQGLERMRAFDPPGALRFFQRAAQADPGSAVVRSQLSQAWSDLGEDAKATEEARWAVQLSGALPQQDRLAIQGWLHQVSKQWDKALESYRSLWTFYPDDIDHGLKLVDCLTNSGRGAEAVEAIAALRALPPPVGNDPRIDLAETRNARRLSDLVTQKRAAEAAVAKGRRSGQDLVVARGLIYQGGFLLRVGHPREALALFQEAERLSRKEGHLWAVGMAMANEAVALQTLGDLEGAGKANQEALAIAQRLGSRVGIAAQLYALGELGLQRGDLAEARRQLDQAYARYIALGDRLMQVQTLNLMGEALYAGGDPEGARQRLEKALTLSRSLGNPAAEAEVLSGLSEVAAQQGDLAAARALAGDQLLLAQKAGAKALTARAHVNLGRVDLAEGKLDAARRSLREAVHGAGEDRQVRLEAAVLLARLAAAEGRTAAAQGELRQALQEAETRGFTALALEARFALGQIQQDSGDPAASATLAAVRRDAEARGFELFYSAAAPISSSKGRAPSPPSVSKSQKR